MVPVNRISKRYFGSTLLSYVVAIYQRQATIEKIRKILSEKKKLKNHYELRKKCEVARINYVSYLKMRSKLIAKLEENPEKYQKLILQIDLRQAKKLHFRLIKLLILNICENSFSTYFYHLFNINYFLLMLLFELFVIIMTLK